MSNSMRWGHLKWVFRLSVSNKMIWGQDLKYRKGLKAGENVVIT